MKQTSLYLIHKNLNAKLVPFAGYEMPIQYTGIIEEHKTVRQKVGVFDVSHMGEFFIEGENAEEFLQLVTINDVSKLFDGKVQYTAICNENGNLIDDVLLYRFTKTKFMLVVNASNIEKDFTWLTSKNNFGVTLSNESDKYSLLAVQGPKAEEVLKTLASTNISAMEYYTFLEGRIGSIEAIISRTGYTGEKGFELYCKSEDAVELWNIIFKSGKNLGIAPIGLGARDTLRLEMGYCLYGNDIDETCNPLEAGLGWITKLKKEKFIGKEKLVSIKNEGLKRKLVGIILEEKFVARHGYNIVNSSIENKIGIVTSGNYSPSLEKPIALAYVQSEYLENENQNLTVDIRGKLVNAKIVPIPFYKGEAQ